ncbi:hypothetical protein AGMMS49991_00740 [Spirochaetia bacterium]|nr:hypothetical protein AGMMS49991_00740 [Spirochaetia bacterium]
MNPIIGGVKFRRIPFGDILWRDRALFEKRSAFLLRFGMGPLFAGRALVHQIGPVDSGGMGRLPTVFYLLDLYCFNHTDLST